MASREMRKNGVGRRSKVAPVSLVCALAAILAGCARYEPFVLDPAEFDRKSIGRPARIPGPIQVCYSANVASTDAVIRLAENECAKFGKTPQMIGQDISACPITTPISAHYLCCPSIVDPALRYRCGAGEAKVERLNNEQVREALAAARRSPTH